MEHKWVRHTLVPVKVELTLAGDFRVTREGHASQLVGCDACGLPLTQELLEEPCLADLEDQLEDGS